MASYGLASSFVCLLMSVYEPDGREIIDRLWGETMEEFDFADVKGILKDLKE